MDHSLVLDSIVGGTGRARLVARRGNRRQWSEQSLSFISGCGDWLRLQSRIATFVALLIRSVMAEEAYRIISGVDRNDDIPFEPRVPALPRGKAMDRGILRRTVSIVSPLMFWIVPPLSSLCYQYSFIEWR